MIVMSKPNATAKTTSAPFLVQIGIYTAVLFIANGLSGLFPANFPVPAPVIGLILLYLALTLHIVKLEWVDSVGSFLISIIGFLFVPSGISLAANLKIMQQQGLQLAIVIICATIILLVVTTYTAKGLIWAHQLLKTGFSRPTSSATNLTRAVSPDDKERD